MGGPTTPPPAPRLEPLSLAAELEQLRGRMIQPSGSDFIVWHPWGGAIIARFATEPEADAFVSGYIEAADRYGREPWDEW